MAIKFNGVRRQPGRPTLVEGVEGRRYVDNKILKNLERMSCGYDSFSNQQYISPYAYSPGQSLDELESEEFETYVHRREPNTVYGDTTDESKTHYFEDQVEEYTHEVQNEIIDADAEPGVNLVWELDYVERATTLSYEEPQFQNQQVEEYEQVWVDARDSEVYGNDVHVNEDSPETHVNEVLLSDYSQEKRLPQNEVEDSWESEDMQSSSCGKRLVVFDESFEPNGSIEEGFKIDESFKACVENVIRTQTNLEMRLQQSLEETPETRINAPVQITVPTYRNPEAILSLRDKKTGILRLPSLGVVRSSQGTVELLVHASGLTFKPTYNRCGILVSVTISDGRKIDRTMRGGWRLIDADGFVVKEEITTVSFDKKGNLWYRTASGKVVTFFVDGRVAC